MEQFINWGSGQNNLGSRLEDDMREWAINKMIREARSSSSSASVTGGAAGGGSLVSRGEKATLVLYWNGDTNRWEFITGVPENGKFYQTRTIEEVEEGASIYDIFPVDKGGWVIRFTLTNNDTHLVMVKTDGTIVSQATIASDQEITMSSANGRIVFIGSATAQMVWLFDGTTLRIDDQVLPANCEYSIGTNMDTTSDGRVVLSVGYTDGNGATWHDWWLLTISKSTRIEHNNYQETNLSISFIAKWNSQWLIKRVTRQADGQHWTSIINPKTGVTAVTWEWTIDTSLTNWAWYGESGAILLEFAEGDQRYFRGWDPTMADPLWSFNETQPSPDGTTSTRYTTKYSGSNYANPPADTIAILIYQLSGDTAIAGNLTGINGATLITKFKGQAPTSRFVEIGYADIWNLTISNEAIIMAASEDGTTYNILKITPTTANDDWGWVADINFPYSGTIMAAALNRIANGFLVQVAYAAAESSYVYVIDNAGNTAESSSLVLPGIDYSQNTDWYDEAGPLLFYVYDQNKIWAWLPDAAEWRDLGNDSTDYSRQATSSFTQPSRLDGENYLLTSYPNGLVVSRNDVVAFDIASNNVISTYLGSNGFLMVSTTDTNMMRLDLYSITGALVSSLITEYDQLETSGFVDTRALVVLSKSATPTQKAIYIGGRSSWTTVDLANASNATRSFNDFCWWD